MDVGHMTIQILQLRASAPSLYSLGSILFT